MQCMFQSPFFLNNILYIKVSYYSIFNLIITKKTTWKYKNNLHTILIIFFIIKIILSFYCISKRRGKDEEALKCQFNSFFCRHWNNFTMLKWKDQFVLINLVMTIESHEKKYFYSINKAISFSENSKNIKKYYFNL